MSLELQNSIGIRQESKVILSAAQRQSLHILQLPAGALEEEITAELAANPFLECSDPLETMEPETPESHDKSEDSFDENGEEPEDSGEFTDEWREELPVPGGDGEEPRSFLDYTPAPGPGLREQLAMELKVTKLEPRCRKLCRAVIDALEENGYLRTPLADIAMHTDSTIEEMDGALKVVQNFDPPGVGARSLGECWKLQLERKNQLTPILEELIDTQLEEIAANRADHAAANLKITLPELDALLETLRHLKNAPHPVECGSAVLIPDAEIYVTPEGEFAAKVARERRSLRLSDAAKYADSPDAGEDFRNQVRNAQSFLEAIEFRKSTLLRLTEMLIEHQRDFLENGPSALHPFTEKAAAEILQFKSESTVSRAIAGKNVATPQGTYPFKYFFSAGYTKEDGTTVSRKADMELLKELIDNEDKRTPYSDDLLSDLLRQAGHPVARRTVVKYRKLLNIPSSNLRKKIL